MPSRFRVPCDGGVLPYEFFQGQCVPQLWQRSSNSGFVESNIIKVSESSIMFFHVCWDVFISGLVSKNNFGNPGWGTLLGDVEPPPCVANHPVSRGLERKKRLASEEMHMTSSYTSLSRIFELTSKISNQYIWTAAAN